MRINKHAFNHKLFHINNLFGNNKRNTNLSIQTCWLTEWSFYRASALRLNHIHRSLSFNYSFSLFSPIVLSTVSLLCLVNNLIYNLLLLFIGNLRIVSTWIYRIAINGCNNYLPTNLASEINSTGLDCRIVDSSLLSDWPTRSWLIQTLTESAGLRYESASN